MPNRLPLFWVTPSLIRVINFFVPINIEAITLGPLVLSKSVLPEEVVRHERIHYLQYKELFFIGFLVLYLWDFVKGYCIYRKWNVAYQRIRFEQEAYRFMYHEGYCACREGYAWKKFSIR